LPGRRLESRISGLLNGRSRKVSSMEKPHAERIAERALTFLAERPPSLQQFLTASGLDASALLERMSDPLILAAATAFVAGDEVLAKEFSQSERLKPGMLVSACAALDPHGSSAW
jgi:hypothetical protein